jgi:fido (protein-threonine AMPylation protein)
LVAVHPFVNGNGRHARLLADVVLFNRELPPIDWGGPALEGAGAARSRYIQALQSADKGDYEPLLEFAGG